MGEVGKEAMFGCFFFLIKTHCTRAWNSQAIGLKIQVNNSIFYKFYVLKE